MKEERAEKNTIILKNLPYIINWIKIDDGPSVCSARLLRNLWPELYVTLKSSKIDEINEIISKYKRDKIYQDYVSIILSPKGQKWFINILQKVREDMESSSPSILRK